MPIYRSPEEKASETVTIRLTIHERRMLDHLASLEEKTLTDFLRGLIAKRASELDITEPPPPKPKRRPGRPKMKRPGRIAPPAPETPLSTSETQAPAAAAPELSSPATPPPSPLDDIPILVDPEDLPETPLELPEAIDINETPAPDPDKMTVLDLIERFKETFVHRADGTKRELNDTMTFFFSGKNGPPIVPPELPIESLSSERLKAVRQAVKESELRLAKKNLHLTYFRMMLHFGVKEPDIDIRVNPTRDLEPLTITESNEGWRFFTGPSK